MEEWKHGLKKGLGKEWTVLAERFAENSIKTPRMWDLGLWQKKKKKEAHFKLYILSLEVKVELYYLSVTHTCTPICLYSVAVVQTRAALTLLPLCKIIKLSIGCGLRNKPGWESAIYYA